MNKTQRIILSAVAGLTAGNLFLLVMVLVGVAD
ncbi:hypothetical protein LCGC14_0587670 [marine sediment metagenome]|uniref:Uncharacterized protein n=1 Tax=marine sediment metagenome TaxID=412755 RepID=A0A0F9RJF3_9ZZZZ